MRICHLQLLVIMLALATSLGCAAEAPTSGEHAHETGKQAGHDHPDTGPRGGQLIELGSEGAFHAELIHDEAAHRVTIHVLDGSARKDVPITERELLVNIVSGGAPRQFPLAATPQADDAAGRASSFLSEDPELSAALDEPKAKGRLSITIDGKQYVGEIAAHDHSHATHLHDSK